MNKTKCVTYIFVLISLTLAACGAPTPVATPTVAATTAPMAPPTLVATAAPVLPPTAAATAAPAATSTPAATAVPQIPSGGDLVMGLNASPETLDPAKALGVQEACVMRQIYDTMVYVDANHQLHAGLATDWQQSADATVFTFTLRSGVVFHDGTSFDAAAVKYNFDRLGNTDIGTGSASTYFTDYGSTDVIDSQTARVSFKSPHPTFLLSLGSAYAGIVSPKAAEAAGKDFGQHPVGTGPFMFKEWVPGDRVVLTRNPAYAWAPDILGHQGPAYLDTVTFRFVTEDATRMAMLQSGEASVIEQFPAQDMSWLQTDAQYYLVSGIAPGLPTVMEMNTEKPPTDELAVRQALIYAIDQESLVKAAFFGTQDAAHSVLAPSTLYYDPVAGQMYQYDLAKAKSLLDGAGWVDQKGDGVREKNGQPLEINYPAYRVWENSYMELLQNMWSAAGFRVNLQQLEDAAAWDAAVAGEHNVTNMGSISFDAAVLLPSFQSANIAQGYAFTRYRDPELDKTLDEAAQAIDPAAKSQAYAKAQRLIMEQALVVPVYDFKRILAVRAQFPGVTIDWENWYPYFYDTYLKQ
jgi:peptide/nickel transport system substrate-binding protein